MMMIFFVERRRMCAYAACHARMEGREGTSNNNSNNTKKRPPQQLSLLFLHVLSIDISCAVD